MLESLHLNQLAVSRNKEKEKKITCACRSVIVDSSAKYAKKIKKKKNHSSILNSTQRKIT